MKKEYRKPETEVTRFEAVDVITTSGMSSTTNDDTIRGDNGDWWLWHEYMDY